MGTRGRSRLTRSAVVPDCEKQQIALTSVVSAISRASADFDQAGWTSAQAIDGDLKSGWAIHPRVNESHHIVFELGETIDISAGGKLAVTLKQLYPPIKYREIARIIGNKFGYETDHKKVKRFLVNNPIRVRNS